LYYYATINYIGGGFNKSGIHNTLEAAVWGKPVFFGPNYQKFKEAKELIARGGALTVSDPLIFKNQLTQFLSDETHLLRTGKIARKYVMTNIGATEKIIKYIRQNVF
ncbi:MAG TPA: 3-deoxy-D-manno-octulosonic acid transferase, partial [Flavisolibacter sp.]|nr:3-deoxy-D-manno-octulosonic acid transferase [Flavisolibacter sp.]